jgi:hypothetical protein
MAVPSERESGRYTDTRSTAKAQVRQMVPPCSRPPPVTAYSKLTADPLAGAMRALLPGTAPSRSRPRRPVGVVGKDREQVADSLDPADAVGKR